MDQLFSTSGISPALVEVVGELGYEKLTPIQAKSIPVLLQGKDLIGQSKTGSGKTAAYSLPILNRLSSNGGLQALILCPTRELCTQVAREIRKFGRKHPGLQVLILSGGQPLFPQLTALEKGVHIAVGTPGRVLDHLARGTLDLSRITTLVLDEADRMLDMGFKDDMEKILAQTPPSRQTLFFSATFPSTIEALSRRFQRNPVKVVIEENAVEAPSIRQVVFEVDPSAKQTALFRILGEFLPGAVNSSQAAESAIIFCNLKTTVIELTNALIEAGSSAACLHGDLEQSERDRVMAKFRNQSVSYLVATDVAARGIDVENLDAVINFDLPPQPDVYVHRIGRTGRAGKLGAAISLASSREVFKIQKIEEAIGLKLERKSMGAQPPASETVLRKPAKMETFYISAGRKDKMRPGDILGALTGEAGGLQGSEIGKIEIHDRFSYVAISKASAGLALERLRNGRIKGRKLRIEPVL